VASVGVRWLRPWMDALFEDSIRPPRTRALAQHPAGRARGVCTSGDRHGDEVTSLLSAGKGAVATRASGGWRQLWAAVVPLAGAAPSRAQRWGEGGRMALE
jgi:hypothetical protein